MFRGLALAPLPRRSVALCRPAGGIGGVGDVAAAPFDAELLLGSCQSDCIHIRFDGGGCTAAKSRGLAGRRLLRGRLWR
eukprot:14761057-Alexandrium_andersonii.AAC.1